MEANEDATESRTAYWYSLGAASSGYGTPKSLTSAAAPGAAGASGAGVVAGATQAFRSGAATAAPSSAPLPARN